MPRSETAHSAGMVSHKRDASHTEHRRSHYIRLLAMAVVSFLSMYALMYSMVNSFSNVFPNFNQFYMAGLMTAPMILIELALMGAMYEDKRLNAAIAAAALIAGIAFFGLIRMQTAVSDRQFLKSMIPHHAGAILMCQSAPIHDPEIVRLCRGIMSSQQSEIDQMKTMLSRLDNS